MSPITARVMLSEIAMREWLRETAEDNMRAGGTFSVTHEFADGAWFENWVIDHRGPEAT